VIKFQLLLISSKLASQYIFQSIIVNQTSIIIVLSLIFSNFNNQGCPTAQITISADFVYFEILGVLELQLIKVAQAFISITPSGFQTILLLQTTTTSFHDKLISNSSKIHITQYGVQGAKPSLSQIKTFH
jgi:hypothetical protein